MRRFFDRLLNAVRPARRESELAREVAAHLALLEDEYRRRGMSEGEARKAARLAIGGVEQTKERHRDARSFRWLDDARRDLQYTLRLSRRTPAFTSVAILTLALGIGANTAIFSVINAVLLRPLPYQGSERLVHVFQLASPSQVSATARRSNAVDPMSFYRLQEQSRTLSHVAGSIFMTMTLMERGDARRLEGSQVSAAAFPMLGIPALIGRAFEPSEESAGSDAVIVLSHAAWQQHFAADADIIGRVIQLDGRGRSVVGIMPRGFAFPDPHAQFWVPLVRPAPDARNFIAPAVTARVKDGVSVDAARAEVNTILGPDAGRSYELVSIQDALVDPVRPALRVLAAAVGAVLLIACVNVANLLLERAASRRTEIAVRVALGAGRARIVRQILTESLLIAGVGGALGIALAFGGIALLHSLAANLARRDLGPGVSIPRLDQIDIDATVLLFTIGLSLMTGMVCGVLPALRQSRSQPSGTLREAASSSRVGGMLVVTQIALAMMLLAGGALLIHSFVRLSNVDPGYDPENVLTFQVAARRPPGELRNLAEELVSRLQSMPGVRSAGFGNNVPLIQQGFARTVTASPPGEGQRPPQPLPGMHAVSRAFTTTFGLRVIEGRGFSQGESATREALVNRALARSGFLGDQPLGKTIYSRNVAWEVVGILEDVRQWSLAQPPLPEIYIVDFLPPPPGLGGAYFAVRTDLDPTAIARDIRGIVRQLDPQATMDNVATMEQLVSNSISAPRLNAVLLGIFASIATILSTIGIYGVMSYSVARRTREIGIRMALGAERSNVLRLVLRQGLALAVLGIALGLAGAAATTRYLETLLFGVTPLDPVTFASASILFALIAAAAAYLPARRAARVDPLVAIRWE